MVPGKIRAWERQGFGVYQGLAYGLYRFDEGCRKVWRLGYEDLLHKGFITPNPKPCVGFRAFSAWEQQGFGGLEVFYGQKPLTLNLNPKP